MRAMPFAGRSRLRPAVALLAVVTLALSACNKPPEAPVDPIPSGGVTLEELVTAAEAEGSLTIYTGDAEDVIKTQIEAFQAKYDIKVEYVRALTDQMNARILSEYQAGVYAVDFIQGGSLAFLRDNPELFRKLNAEVMPDFEAYPAPARADHSVYLRENPTLVHYNPDIVPASAVPKTWDDLLNPALKGHMLLSDPQTSESYMVWAQVMVDNYGIDYLRKLKDQEFTVVSAGTAAAQQVVAGTAWISFPARAVHSATLRAQGAPIDYVVMGGPATGSLVPGAVFARAPHPNAALLFLHFMMSPEGQEVVCAKFEVNSFYNIDGKSPEQQVKGCQPPPPNWALVDQIPTKEQYDAIVEALGL